MISAVISLLFSIFFSSLHSIFVPFRKHKVTILLRYVELKFLGGVSSILYIEGGLKEWKDLWYQKHRKIMHKIHSKSV